ncbi:DUF6777 domain-containing protein [Modestobacter excelsi]|uniref:DUF6777 domain-containing protein n=1 Tax=Modestobacter excelsi TaxID=2213161 RepID=UPI00110CEB5C|nr:DUF6777 domain-containing protein [Modestobacter excelsi]
MEYPSADDYVRAVQHPADVFAEESLQQARFEVHPLLGIPMPASGSTAVVFKAYVAGEPQALRFFIREDVSSRERYTALGGHLRDSGLGPNVALAEWADNAIRIGERQFPMIRMQWVEGRTLDRYADHLVQQGDLQAIAALAGLWRDLIKRMQAAWFAHGDLQHGNVLVDEHGTLRLVDFDCAWIRSFEGKRPPIESGHRNYQRAGDRWGPWMDTFPALVIYLSLLALSRSARPWELYNEDNLIFSHRDFTAPFETPVWQQLAVLQDSDVDRVAGQLRACCDPAWKSEMDLEAVLAGNRRIVITEYDWVTKSEQRHTRLHGTPTAGSGSEREPIGVPGGVLPPPPPIEVPYVAPEPAPLPPADAGSGSGDITPASTGASVATVARPRRQPPPTSFFGALGLSPGLAAAGVLFLAVALVVTAVVVLGSSSTAVVRAEPADVTGPAPFTPDASGADSGQPPIETPDGTVTGDNPGIYGGANANTCDTLAIATFLETHPSQARAWASIQGIQPSGIREYLGGLTPVTLRTDTAVTNHDYRDGSALPLQSILQAGTAVLIDERGTPRVRCACGNPLRPPDHEPVTSYEVDSSPWAGFSAERVTVIQPAAAPLSEFVLVLPDGDAVPDNDVVIARPRGTQGEEDHPAPPAETEAARAMSDAPEPEPSSPRTADESSIGPTKSSTRVEPGDPTGETSGSGSGGSTPPTSQPSGPSVAVSSGAERASAPSSPVPSSPLPSSPLPSSPVPSSPVPSSPVPSSPVPSSPVPSSPVPSSPAASSPVPSSPVPSSPVPSSPVPSSPAASSPAASSPAASSPAASSPAPSSPAASSPAASSPAPASQVPSSQARQAPSSPAASSPAASSPAASSPAPSSQEAVEG